MPEQPQQPLPVRKAIPPPRPVVYYSRHLWRTARQDTWACVQEEKQVGWGASSAIFVVAAFLTFLCLGTDTPLEYLSAVAIGLAAVGFGYAVFLAAHCLYLTPRKLLARKQVQLDFLRDEMNAKNSEIVSLKRSLAMKTVEKHEREKQSLSE